ncbi:MAG: nucleotidyltransferase family protein [Pyrinomonadaceae bacterium]|nr:nucleotidyltransferase family protein [Pyrinomonadaceae bacterium]
MTQFSEETRQKIAELCRKNKVRELSIFGSRARGDCRPDSDYDLLVEFYPDSGIGLLEYCRFSLDLGDVLKKRVDLVSKKGLREHVRKNVLGDAQVIYEA